jgi:hypothetical protein
MSDFEELLWFVCSLVNLAALIMAWIQIFEILQLELQGLEEQQKVGAAGHRQPAADPAADTQLPCGAAAAAAGSWAPGQGRLGCGPTCFAGLISPLPSHPTPHIAHTP